MGRVNPRPNGRPGRGSIESKRRARDGYSDVPNMQEKPEFQLHHRLADDTGLVTDWPLCRVLLMNESAFPWLVLVPRCEGLRDFHELADDDLTLASAEIVRASRLLETVFTPDKINVAALGNQVFQLHIHVIARFTSDAAWPKPVWGVTPHDPYSPEALEERLRILRENTES